MGFLNKKKGIVLVRIWGFEWLTKFVYPQGTVIGQEIVDKENLEKAVMEWVGRELKGRLDVAEIVLAETVVFSKEIADQTKFDEFWLEVPIDPLTMAKLVVKGDKTWKLYASNSEMYEILIRALELNKISVTRVIPEAIKQLPKLDIRQKEAVATTLPTNKPKFTTKTLFLGLGLVAALSFMGVMVSKSGSNNPKTAKVTITPSPTVNVIPTSTQIVENQVNITKETIKISILNGSGVAGKAGIMKEFLTSLGYSEIETGNADKDDYLTTQVMIKEGGETVWEVLGADLRSQYELASPEASLEIESDIDVEIIIGAK